MSDIQLMNKKKRFFMSLWKFVILPLCVLSFSALSMANEKIYLDFDKKKCMARHYGRNEKL
jgi:hypothetical protein